MTLPGNLKIGTSSWSAPSWVGPFYPEGTPSNEFITEYAKHFSTVEIDSTFYSIPSKNTVKLWKERTPDNFIFSAKIPRIITHEKQMVNVENELSKFLSVMEMLDEKLGPILFQLKYFKKSEYRTVWDFLDRIKPVLTKKLPEGFKYALEIRNKNWIKDDVTDFLKNNGISLVFLAHPWMPRLNELIKKPGIITADFLYIRWLGDRYKIEKQTKSWDKIIVDRKPELQAWCKAFKPVILSSIPVYGYFNNHYAGHAPASIRMLEQIWDQQEKQ